MRWPCEPADDTTRGRASVADGLAGMLRSAGTAIRFTAAVAPRSGQLLEVAAVIETIERRLRAAEPVAARGVAIVRSLLIDGNGPLYRRATRCARKSVAGGGRGAEAGRRATEGAR